MKLHPTTDLPLTKLTFAEDGICRITLQGLPKSAEIEYLIDKYVSNVEFLPYPLRLIFIDISELVHMEARSRQVFSELLIQASKHYDEKVKLLIAGGSLNLRRYLELFCKSIGLKERSRILPTLAEAHQWIGNQVFNP